MVVRLRTTTRRGSVNGAMGWVLDTWPAVVGCYGVDLRNRLANRAYIEFVGLSRRRSPVVVSSR